MKKHNATAIKRFCFLVHFAGSTGTEHTHTFTHITIVRYSVRFVCLISIIQFIPFLAMHTENSKATIQMQIICRANNFVLISHNHITTIMYTATPALQMHIRDTHSQTLYIMIVTLCCIISCKHKLQEISFNFIVHIILVPFTIYL